MDRSNVTPNRLSRCVAVSCVLLCNLAAGAPPAETKPEPANAASPATSANEQKSPAEMKRWRDWHKSMLQKPAPKSGCFTANYPDLSWQEVPCKPSTPHKMYLPAQGGISSIDVIGGGGPTDFSATVTGDISVAEGSFDSISGITSTNPYSLQLNTAPFTTSACSGSPSPAACQGWEQFVYESSGGGFIQYWLLTYGPAGTQCPTPRHVGCAANSVYSDGWCPFQFSPTGSVYCVVDAVNEVSAPAEAMTSLDQLSVAGTANATNDEIAVTVKGSAPFKATGNNYFSDLSTRWQEAEFNAFGSGSGGQATFNSGASAVVRTEVISGTTAGPGCHLQSWTGETSNLTLLNSPPTSPSPLPAPALVFGQSNPPAAGGTATCADAISLGDTHLTTLRGLLYDFQASGDFTLIKVDPGFEVQTRQQSGAPTWPNAAVNKAVAARFGNVRIAMCTASARNDEPALIFVDGIRTPVEDGKTVKVGEDALIRRNGSSYLMVGAEGDSVTAALNSYNNNFWINVGVGLGRWPIKATGLVANANGNVNQIATRNNVVLTNPFKFDDLYTQFAESWRVNDRDSLLSICNGGAPVEHGVPSRPFYATDLDPQVRGKALGICNAAGVKPGALLDACTLDVAVIGDGVAAQAFVHAAPPIAIGTVAAERTDHGGPAGLPLWLWLLLLLILVAIVWWLLRKKAP